MGLRYHYNPGEFYNFSKHSYRVLCREEDDKAILDPPLHLTLDEPYHLQGAR